MLILKRMLRSLFARPEPVHAAAPAIPAVPVPARLRERLVNYPQQLERLQQVLSSAAQAKGSPKQRFEEAIWALEGRLGSFLAEARERLEVARIQGDADQVARADAEERLMSQIRLKQGWIGDAALWDYFQMPEEPAP